MIDLLQTLFSGLNPGFIVIRAGIVAYFAFFRHAGRLSGQYDDWLSVSAWAQSVWGVILRLRGLAHFQAI